MVFLARHIDNATWFNIDSNSLWSYVGRTFKAYQRILVEWIAICFKLFVSDDNIKNILAAMFYYYNAWTYSILTECSNL